MGKAPVIPGVDVRTVSYHLGQIFASGELKGEAAIRKIGIVKTEGEREKNIRDWYLFRKNSQTPELYKGNSKVH